MAAINERDIGKFLYNPWVIYVADVGDGQPENPSFYTEPAVTFSFNKEFVEAKAYGKAGLQYTVRQDPSVYDFRMGYSIKETTINTVKLSHNGTINSDLDEIYLDGVTQNYQIWAESCYNDDSKIVRLHIPKAKNVDPQEVGSGESHLVHPNMWVALVDPADQASFPSLYFTP